MLVPDTPLKVLLVDDDQELARLVHEYLSAHNVRLERAFDAKSAEPLWKSGAFDVVLLDVMLPDASGFDILRAIRAVSRVPVVMLTARGEDADRIFGLELGAEDYVPKPFNPKELLLRIRVAARRAHPVELRDREVFTLGDLVINVPASTVSLGGNEVELTSFEFRVLVELAKKAGQPVSREDLAHSVKSGAYDASVDRSLDVHIGHLRQKLEEDPQKPKRIRTVRGVGYLLVRPA